MSRFILKEIFLPLMLMLMFLHSWAYAKVPDSVEQQKNAVVTVYVDDRDGKHIVEGTGFIIDPNGIIVTNCQTVQKWFEKIENRVRVELEGGSQFPLEDLVSRRCDNNLALIKIAAKELPTVRLNPNYKPRNGESVFALFNPSESTPANSAGTVKNILKPGRLLRTSIPVNTKNSGSPVFNKQGDVFAVAVLPSRREKNLHVAAFLKDSIKQLAHLQKPPSPAKNVHGREPAKKEPARKEPERVPKDAQDYFLLGYNYENSQHYKEAIEAYKQALQVKPDYVDAFGNLGILYYKLGKYNDAIESFKLALSINPNALQIYNKLGTTYIIRGAYSNAIEIFKKVLQLDPNDTAAHFNLGIAYFLSGDKSAAFEEYVTLKMIDKDRADILREVIFN